MPWIVWASVMTERRRTDMHIVCGTRKLPRQIQGPVETRGKKPV